MSIVVDWVVVVIQAEWIPSLAYLWIDVSRAVVIGINSCQDVIVDAIIVVLESVMEYHLQVGVEEEVVCVVVWRCSTIESDISQCKAGCVVAFTSIEVEGVSWIERDFVNPLIETNF